MLHINDSAWAKCRDLTQEFYGTTSPELVERMTLAISLVPLFAGAALYWPAHSAVA